MIAQIFCATVCVCKTSTFCQKLQVIPFVKFLLDYIYYTSLTRRGCKLHLGWLAKTCNHNVLILVSCCYYRWSERHQPRRHPRKNLRAVSKNPGGGSDGENGHPGGQKVPRVLLVLTREIRDTHARLCYPVFTGTLETTCLCGSQNMLKRDYEEDMRSSATHVIGEITSF